MQPQNAPTNYTQPSIPGQGMPPVVPSGALPPASPAPSRPMPSVESTPAADNGGLEAWLVKLQKVIAETAQDPHARAERIAELKRHYQKEVLGRRERGEG